MAGYDILNIIEAGKSAPVEQRSPSVHSRSSMYQIRKGIAVIYGWPFFAVTILHCHFFKKMVK